MSGRGIITIDGEEYDCSHLDPFSVNLEARDENDRGYKILVSFNHHTFTRSIEEGDPPEFLYEEDNDLRCFCQDRYLASKGLRSLIGYHCKGKAYFGQKSNYMIIDQPLGGAPYVLFFQLRRATQLKGIDALMFVQSAYTKPALPAKSRLPSISFRTLVYKTVANQKIKPPKK